MARFVDLPEAQIAASLLRSGGVPVFITSEIWGAIEFTMSRAFGFRLLVPDDDAEAATKLLGELRDQPVAPAPPSGSLAEAALGLALLTGFGPAAGWLVVGARRLNPVGRGLMLATLVGLLALVGWIVLTANGWLAPPSSGAGG